MTHAAHRGGLFTLRLDMSNKNSNWSLADRLAGKTPDDEVPCITSIDCTQVAAIDDSLEAELVYPISMKAQLGPLFKLYGLDLPKTRVEFTGNRDYVILLGLKANLLRACKSEFEREYFLNEIEAREPGIAKKVVLLEAGKSDELEALHREERRFWLNTNTERLRHAKAGEAPADAASAAAVLSFPSKQK